MRIAQVPLYTDAEISLRILLLKYYNDLFVRQSSGQGRSLIILCWDLFCIRLGPIYADFQEKILRRFLEKKSQTFLCSNVTTMKGLGIFSRNLCADIFLKN